ncbi:MAG TPA: HAMP domain-containing protein, partial [Sporichthyaceae bacterium]
MRRPVVVPRINLVEPLAPTEPRVPDRAIWASLVRDAAPADLREIAALTPSPAPTPDTIPVKVGQRTTFFHYLATRFNNLTLKVRVGALVAMVVGLTVAITSLAAFFTIRAQLYNSFDRSLIGRAQALELTPATDFNAIIRVPSGIFAAADTRLAILYKDGSPYYASPEDAPPFGAPEIKVATTAPYAGPRTMDLKGKTYRVYTIPKIQEDGTRTAFVLAQTTGEIDRTLRELGTALLVIGLAGVALATYAGVVVARQGLRPVSQLTQAAEHVAKTGDLRPIKVRGDDELARLGASFNSMLLA